MTQRPRALETLEFDHLELWVGNAKQAAHYYCTAFGFEPLAYAGPETGLKGRASYAVRQNELVLVLTSALTPDDPVAEHVKAHGDGVRDVALRTSDARGAFAAAVGGGARPLAEPAAARDAGGEVVTARIATYGETVHTFVERGSYRGVWLPGYEPWSAVMPTAHRVGLVRIDHCVGNVGWGEMDRWCDYYANALGFTQLIGFDDKDISTEYTALRSKVMQSPSGKVKMPINEPAEGLKRSQIEEYLDFYGGPGIQHVAIATGDIVETVRALRGNGVELLETPASYYDTLGERVGAIAEDVAILRELNILVDRDDKGYMLQIFTKPLQDRPTLFFEIIQRRGSLSFGKGNFKALFVSIEQEQAKRGNL
ncbi:MAG TPA: 4-hydroxyphenylpyruvate dioxygenase [Candidatus Elarobacter sp.]|jgi:4-hydroxyphenylpyruvate dioxygenase|nr:4-hydroxyphenylpyruvate dioxygenase [Candidatus Elarobacter sp.]